MSRSPDPCRSENRAHTRAFPGGSAVIEMKPRALISATAMISANITASYHDRVLRRDIIGPAPAMIHATTASN